MDVLRTAILVLGFVLLPALQAPARWKLFESSTQHFCVLYPPSWNRLLEVGGVPNSERLAIINFPNSQRLRGVVIKDGGALISVNAAPVEAAPSNVRSLDDWVRWYEKNEEALDDRDIPTSTPAPGGCQQLRRIVTREDMGSGAFSIGTVYFCSTKHGLYVVILSNWEGDPHQGDLQDTALKIAKSLRSR